jgi:hypothetical protein
MSRKPRFANLKPTPASVLAAPLPEGAGDKSPARPADGRPDSR